MKAVLSKLTTRKCEHHQTLVVRSVGVQRTICEGCGHVSFVMSSNLATFQGPVIEDKPGLPRVSGL